jgi:molybdenum cofactor synthesis domain-containing protein
LFKKLEEFYEKNVNLIIITGGTGLAPRDITPETVKKFVDREILGISIAIINYSLTKTPNAMLGRIFAGSKDRTLIICLPGSLKAVKDAFEVIGPSKNEVLVHAMKKLIGDKHKCGEKKE